MDWGSLGVLVGMLGMASGLIWRASKIETLAESTKDLEATQRQHETKIAELQGAVATLAETSRGTRDDVRYIRDRLDRALNGGGKHA